MITEELIKFLDNDNETLRSKCEQIKKCHFTYSDIIDLLDRYSGTGLQPALMALVYDNVNIENYKEDKFISKDYKRKVKRIKNKYAIKGARK